MIEILKEFKTEVQENNGTKTVTYCHPTFPHFSGVCVYNKVTTKGLRKPISQYFLILISTDMGDVIEYIHKKSPLSSEDLSSINKLIRDHSLSVVLNNTNDLH
jgi:hypothetical protein